MMLKCLHLFILGFFLAPNRITSSRIEGKLREMQHLFFENMHFLFKLSISMQNFVLMIHISYL